MLSVFLLSVVVPSDRGQHTSLFGAMAFSIIIFSLMTLRIKGLLATLSINDIQHVSNAIMLNVANYYCYAECRYAQCHYAKCRGAA